MGFVISNTRTGLVTAVGFLLLICFTGFETHAQLLPLQEVKALETISQKLQNSFWNNISQSSCQNVGSSFNKNITDDFRSNVTCDCTFANNTCHVTIIEMKGLNLTGILPEEFGNLTHLQELDLTRNYINGSIPTGISRAPLRILSLLGNRLSGSIPKEIGDIATLTDLVLEDNQLEGPLPENLGSLSSLSRLLLSANNFTGKIPESFGNLKNLTDIRIDGSRISGKMPTFIGNWTKLDRLDMQGTSMEGPIPSTISLLTNLTELRISDLNESSMPFPNLEDLKILERVILRNCSITGSIPAYIGELTKLKELDLSFNKLTGEVPTTVENLDSLDYMFLTNNLLTGDVSSWILNNKNKFDLSYNNFSGSPAVSCQQLPVNLISSFSSPESLWCLQKDLPCSTKPKHYSMFINCGGSKMDYDGKQYEDDSSPGGPSDFFSSSERWGYSSTGIYLGNTNAYFKATNTSSLNVNDSDFYQTARLAPVSLKYYGLCMLKGPYKVQLHFAEIMYTNNETFTGIGKRIFDVSIQGNLVLEDFNIMKEAGGAGIGIVKEFDVLVYGSTLEIHLYWKGKGTTAIPDRGVYGPLISAITVTPNFKVDIGGGGLSAGAIAGIVVASSFVVVILILAFLRYMGCLGGKDLEDKELRGLDLQTGYFTLRQIKAATGNFDPSNKIGEGGFGPVYKGVLSDGAVIAVKQLSSKSKQGNREFVNEIGMISALQHPNLVRLFGCCIEGNQLLLIYEYMENNSLARALFGREEQRLHLDWKTRKMICIGIARGLAYLHEESRLKIVHRDIKATNVLLDKDLNAKISDFGLAKLDEEENTHISTRIAGTIGYMAPEYAMRGYLTDKADVYSFGIVTLEIVSGKSNTGYRPKEEYVYLLDGAYVLQEQGNMLELVDPDLSSNYNKEEALTMLNLALLCTNPSPTLRPPMSSVVSMLEGKSPIRAPLIKRGSMEQDARFKAFERLSQDSQTYVSSFSQDSHVRGASMEGPWIDSSVSLTGKDESHVHSSTSTVIKDVHDVNLQ
ncbi:probable LRR receptor-like serine/threonine-protein kinase At1g53430 [Argentina anserina]|uniref:probable LRR receptor-like serine/threonine-protein kinase At1g53430 n=1 Tax=Argentina anserina TaxID=57926 RepID=UPI00217638BE|nr:probable LRR receptor-like serine/threonine-protein kinase At1g53430 [Potentilla anserina]